MIPRFFLVDFTDLNADRSRVLASSTIRYPQKFQEIKAGVALPLETFSERKIIIFIPDFTYSND
jgi:hypothetical protein